MSPESGTMLLEQIAPRLRAAIPKVVYPVGAEDAEELVQDALVTAAQMLDAVERHGKTVTPGNIAYYAILAMKSGRRSQCRSRADTMAQGTQLDHKSCVLSMEEEVGYDPELDQAVTLGELLASEREDPAASGARNVDWEAFLAGHDDRYRVVVRGMVEGRTAKDTAKRAGPGFAHIYQLQSRLAEDLREFMGAEAVADALRTPVWQTSLPIGNAPPARPIGGERTERCSRRTESENGRSAFTGGRAVSLEGSPLRESWRPVRLGGWRSHSE